MEDIVVMLIVAAFTVGILALVVVTQMVARQRLQSGWAAIAERAGLTFDPGGFLKRPSAQGRYRGRSVRLYTYTVSHGRSSTTYTALDLSVSNPQGGSLSLRRQGMLDSLGAKLGMQDVQIGDPSFDPQFVIKSDPPEFAAAVLGGNDMLRHALTQIPSLSIRLDGANLKQRQTGLETNPDRLMSLIDALCDLAEAVEKVTRGEETGEEEAAYVEVPEEAEPLFASDARPAMPESAYPYAPADPFGRSQPQVNWRALLIAGFIALDLLVIAAIVVWLLLR